MSQIPTHSSRDQWPTRSLDERHEPLSTSRWGRVPLLVSRALVSALLVVGVSTTAPTAAEASDPKKPARVEKPARNNNNQTRSAPRQSRPPRAQKPPARSEPRQTSRPRNDRPSANKAPRQSSRPQADRPSSNRRETKPRQTQPRQTKPRQVSPQQTQPRQAKPQRVDPKPRRYNPPPVNRPNRPSGDTYTSPSTQSHHPRVDTEPLIRTRRDREDWDDREHTYDDTARPRDYRPGVSHGTNRVRHRDRDDYRHRGRGYYGYHPRYRWYRPGYAYFDGFLGYTGYGRWGWGYYSPIYCNLYGSFWAWNPALSWYWPSRRVYVDVRHSYDNQAPGALDLDVSPEKAQIFIDGDLVGVADNYDGFPTYLYLPPGTYEVAIFHPGYETIFRQYTIYPGAVIDVEDRMVRGLETHPNDWGPTSTKNRDERMRRNRERQEEARRMAEELEALERAEQLAATYPGDEQTTEGAAPQADPAARTPRSSSDSNEAVGRLLLDIVPPDAAVYLDGHFIGTAAEVSGISAGLVVMPGQHDLQVARPGFILRDIEVSIDRGEKLELQIELEPGAP